MSKGEHTHRMILGHAVELASRIGLEALSIGRLATDLRMSKSGLFSHFGSKERLQIEVLDLAAEQFREEVIRPAIGSDDPAEALRRLFASWLRWARSSRGRVGCLFVQASVELDDRSGAVRDRLEELQRAWHDRLARMAREAVEHGSFRPDVDPERFAYEFYALALGYHHSHRLLHHPRAGEMVERSFADLLQRCLAETTP